MNTSTTGTTARSHRLGRLGRRAVVGAVGLSATLAVAVPAGGAFASVPHTDPVCSSGVPYDTSITANPTGDGYWNFTDAAAGKGDGVTQAGDGAPSLGTLKSSDGLLRATPDGKGYYLVDQVGDIESAGDAVAFGSVAAHSHYSFMGCGDVTINPIAGAAVTPSGKGLWTVDAQGQVWPVGDATYYGEQGELSNTSDAAVAIQATPDGKGYTILDNDGSIYTYGDATSYGYTGFTGTASGLATTADGKGYWIMNTKGQIFAFGDANPLPAAPALSGSGASKYTDLVAQPGGQGVLAVSESGFVYVDEGAPIAQDIPGAMTPVSQPLPFQLTARGFVGPARYTIVDGPTDGSVDLDPTSGEVTYTPDDMFDGVDSFTYTATGIDGLVSAPATVTIAVG